MSEDQIADVPPNHLSIDQDSPFYSEEALRRGVGIRFNGVEKTNVYEYDVAEGWVRVEVPTARDRREILWLSNLAVQLNLFSAKRSSQPKRNAH